MAAWAALFTLIAAGRRRARASSADAAGLREALSQISGPERRVVTTALILAVVAYGPVAFQANRIAGGFASTPIGIGDSLGSLAGVRWADRVVDASGHGPAAVFVAAVAHQVSGDGAGARKLYESLPDDKRAIANLAALAENRPTPPSTVTLSDVGEALTSAMTLSDLLSLRGLATLFGSDPVTPILWMTVALGLVFALAQSLNPVSGTRAPAEPPSAWRSLVPGTLDLRDGSPIRGLAALSLASISITALSFAAYAMRFPSASEFISPHTAALRGFPLPAHSFWTVFFAQPGAVTYWSCVGVAALGAILMQVLAIRRARDRNQARSSAEPTLSSQDTRLRA